jgi:hypothetical protein
MLKILIDEDHSLEQELGVFVEKELLGRKVRELNSGQVFLFAVKLYLGFQQVMES